MRRQALKSIAALALAGVMAATLATTLTGCGFQLRGQAALPFASAYVEAPKNSQLAPRLRASLAEQGKLGEKDKAEIVVKLEGEVRKKSILSLSGGGKVREYRLEHGVVLSAQRADGVEVLAPASILLNRDFAYSDNQILAKEAEEAALHNEIEDTILRQILRRLAYVRQQ